MHWSRVTGLFERLLESIDPERTLEKENDTAVRDAARSLWRHHQSAEREDYLGSPMSFEVTTMFQPGQKLLNRFRIEKLLGSGGMGEVYLAWDESLGERVAIKTIARLLSASPSIRKKFAAEVRSARRVTHPNVCRIYDLSEDGETVFFSMEYIDGVLLPELLTAPLPRGWGEMLARQLAEGLHAAHKTGVVHGDLKSANVMVVGSESNSPRAVIMDFGLARWLDGEIRSAENGLSMQAGTLEYMAPELRAGSPPSVRSDIFAFARVAAQLAPGNRLWDECSRPNPKDRPESLARVIERLRPETSRRYWIAGLSIASVATAKYVAWPSGKSRLDLPSNTRILVNGFRAVSTALHATRLARSFVVTSLRQSARIHAIADEDLLPLLSRLKLNVNLPLAGPGLDNILTGLGASFWIDGDVRQSGGRYSLDVRLMQVMNQQVVAASAFHDEPNVIALAEAASAWVRRTVGESEQSLAANPTKVTAYTSAVPEALQKYYEGMEYYAVADMGAAIPSFEEAVRLDPNFAQAHHMLGMTLNPIRQDDAFRELELALRLAQKLPHHERISIETSYYRLTGDPVKMVETASRNVADRPEEPRRQGLLGQAFVNSGRFPEAISSFRKAVELAPNDWMQLQRLESALVEAGQFEEALKVFQGAVSRQVLNRWIYNGAGSAYVGLGRYPDALTSFANQPPQADNVLDIQAVKLLQGNLGTAIAAVEEQRGRATSALGGYRANEFLCALYFAVDRRASALGCVRDMVEISAYPAAAERLACAASWARRLGDNETLARIAVTANEISRRWPNARTQGTEIHIRGLQRWSANSPEEAENLLLKSSGAIFSVWMLFDLADFFTDQAKWDLAEEYWQRFEEHRGTVIAAGWCTAILVLGWYYRAVAAQGRNDRAIAYLGSTKVLGHWASANPLPDLVRRADKINFLFKPN